MLFNRGLRAWCADNEIKLKESELIVLVSIHFKGHVGVTGLETYHLSLFRSLGLKKLTICLNRFISLGWVEVKRSNPNIYTLTLLGRNVLDGIETRCRLTRVDR